MKEAQVLLPQHGAASGNPLPVLWSELLTLAVGDPGSVRWLEVTGLSEVVSRYF